MIRDKFNKTCARLHIEHYKTLPRKMKEDLSNWRAVLCSLTGRQYWQDVNFSQLDLWIQPNPSQNPNKLFCRMEKCILKFIKWKGKRRRISNIKVKNNKVGGLVLPNVKTYYKARVIKTVWYCYKDEHADRSRGAGTFCQWSSKSSFNSKCIVKDVNGTTQNLILNVISIFLEVGERNRNTVD